MAQDRTESDVVGGLLGLIVHDLRNPLSALHSNASYLQSASESGAPDAKEALDDVVASCEALGHIIDNVELLGLSLRGEQRFERSSFTLRDLLTDADSRSRSLATSYSVQVEYETATPDVRLSSSREMLARSLGNLIKNAIQHAQDGKPVRVTTTVSGERVAVLVEDGGPAVAAELRLKAFTAEGQLSAKGQLGARYSRGLGLLAARLAAEAAGAIVSAVPRATGSGNAFELVLSVQK